MEVVYVYILRCSDNSYYTGISANIDNRLSQHRKKRVSYTRKRLPIDCVHVEHRETRKEAARLERRIKNIGAKKYLLTYYAGVFGISLHL